MNHNVKDYLQNHIDMLIEDESYTNYKGIQKLLIFAPGEIQYDEYNELIEILKEFGYKDIEKLRHQQLFDILEVKTEYWQSGKSKDKQFIKLQPLLTRYASSNENFYGYTLSDIEKVCLEYGQIGDLKFSLYKDSDPSEGVLVEYIGA